MSDTDSIRPIDSVSQHGCHCSDHDILPTTTYRGRSLLLVLVLGLLLALNETNRVWALIILSILHTCRRR